MDEKFQFWYPVVVELQTSFLDKHVFSKEVLCSGHILHSGRLMCGESMEITKNQCGAKKEKTVKLRVPNVAICPTCLAKYMRNGDSAYRAWVEGKALKVTSIEKPVYSAEGK